MTKKEIVEKAVYVTCRSCGCEYLEQKEWIMNDFTTSCPACKVKLRLF